MPNPVKIKSVSYRASIQIKSFQHVHIEMTADVPEGVAPREVVDTLAQAVALELVRAKDGETPKPVSRPGKFSDILGLAAVTAVHPAE